MGARRDHRNYAFGIALMSLAGFFLLTGAVMYGDQAVVAQAWDAEAAQLERAGDETAALSAANWGDDAEIIGGLVLATGIVLAILTAILSLLLFFSSPDDGAS